jgi:large subunit ribosomal protein L24
VRVLKYRKNAKTRLHARHAENAERQHVHVSKGDTVRVMRGEDKGKEGKVLRVYLKTGRVLIEGINLVKMHRKARTADEESGIREAPASVHASNVMLLDPKSRTPTRTRTVITTTDGTHQEQRRTKERVSVRNGEAIPRVR